MSWVFSAKTIKLSCEVSGDMWPAAEPSSRNLKRMNFLLAISFQDHLEVSRSKSSEIEAICHCRQWWWWSGLNKYASSRNQRASVLEVYLPETTELIQTWHSPKELQCDPYKEWNVLEFFRMLYSGTGELCTCLHWAVYSFVKSEVTFSFLLNNDLGLTSFFFFLHVIFVFNISNLYIIKHLFGLILVFTPYSKKYFIILWFLFLSTIHFISFQQNEELNE